MIDRKLDISMKEGIGIIQSWAQVDVGFWVMSPAVQIAMELEPTEKFGDFIFSTLLVQQSIPDAKGRDLAKKQLFKLTKTRSWKSFYEQTSTMTVEREGSSINVTPMIYRGSRGDNKGLHPTSADSHIFEINSDGTVDAVLLAKTIFDIAQG